MSEPYDPAKAPTEEAVKVLVAAHGMSEIEARFALSIMRRERTGDIVEVGKDDASSLSASDPDVLALAEEFGLSPENVVELHLRTSRRKGSHNEKTHGTKAGFGADGPKASRSRAAAKGREIAPAPGGGRRGKRYDARFQNGEFASNQEAADNPEVWGTREFDRWRGELSSSERLAIRNYSDEGYARINRELRENKGDNGDPPTYLKLLDSAVEKGDVPADVTGYRMFYDPEIKRRFDDDTLVGTEVTDHGFTSTSLKETAASAPDELAGPPMIAKIHIPKDSKGVYLNGLSEYAEEAELLLGRGSTFRVSKAYKLQGGALKLEMELVAQ